MTELFESLVTLGPWLTAMVCLLALSGFFSASETAVFYLSRQHLQSFRSGNRGERLALELLRNPNRLLTAILFWNLVINLSYFALSSVVAVTIERQQGGGAGGLFGLVTLIVLILLGEVLPKTVALILRAWLAGVISLPLSIAVRAVDPIAPALKTFTILSRRLFWPHIRLEPYLTPEDLERAVAVSTTDRALVETERVVLDNILDLSEIRADEIMRPRGNYRVFRPPVSRTDLQRKLPPSGYVLVTEPNGEDIAGALPLYSLTDVPREHLEHYAEKPVFVPWCASAARVLEEMRGALASVAGVVDEYGSMVGVVTFEDLLDTVLSEQTDRTDRLLRARAIRQVGPGRYHVEGMTTLRSLARYFDVPYQPRKPTTLAGYLHEQLERLPQPGDTCRWEQFEVRVVREIGRGRLLLELSTLPTEAKQEARG